MCTRIPILTLVAVMACLSVQAQPQPGEEAEKFPVPPRGFDTRYDGIDRGKLETVEYDS